MTKMIFRISWTDAQKLLPLYEAFGKKSFTISTAEQECLPSITKGDIKRFNSSLYIVKSGTTKSDTKYHHEQTLWKLSDRTIHSLTKQPRTRR
jgi:hypothetical protein